MLDNVVRTFRKARALHERLAETYVKLSGTHAEGPFGVETITNVEDGIELVERELRDCRRLSAQIDTLNSEHLRKKLDTMSDALDTIEAKHYQN